MASSMAGKAPRYPTGLSDDASWYGGFYTRLGDRPSGCFLAKDSSYARRLVDLYHIPARISDRLVQAPLRKPAPCASAN